MVSEANSPCSGGRIEISINDTNAKGKHLTHTPTDFNKKNNICIDNYVYVLLQSDLYFGPENPIDMAYILGAPNIEY